MVASNTYPLAVPVSSQAFTSVCSARSTFYRSTKAIELAVVNRQLHEIVSSLVLRQFYSVIANRHVIAVEKVIA